MNTVTKAEIKIDKPIEKVFEFISRIEDLEKFWPKVVAADRVSGDGSVGSTYKIEFKTLFSKRSIEVEVVENLSPLHFAFKNNSVPISVVNGYRLEKVEEGGTNLEIYREYEDTPKVLLKSMSFLVNYEESRESKREFEKILKKLKEEIEGND